MWEAAGSFVKVNLLFYSSENVSDINFSIMVAGYSGADMANLCREAAYGPVREAAGSIQHISAEDVRPALNVGNVFLVRVSKHR